MMPARRQGKKLSKTNQLIDRYPRPISSAFLIDCTSARDVYVFDNTDYVDVLHDPWSMWKYAAAPITCRTAYNWLCRIDRHRRTTRSMTSLVSARQSWYLFSVTNNNDEKTTTSFLLLLDGRPHQMKTVVCVLISKDNQGVMIRNFFLRCLSTSTSTREGHSLCLNCSWLFD